MNEARRQAARPGDFGGGPDGGRKLPNEVKAMARQMGISAKELSEVGDTTPARAMCQIRPRCVPQRDF